MKTKAWLALSLLLLLPYVGWGQGSAFHLLPEDRQIVVLWSAVEYLREDVGRMITKLDSISTALAETWEEIAEMRGRQSVSTGIAAGTPTGLAGLLFWWLRRKKKIGDVQED